MTSLFSSPDQLLKRSGQAWFITAGVGQLAFIIFILAYYLPRTLAGDFAAWDDKGLIVGYEEGDPSGNFGFISHVLGAAVITSAGLMQLWPWLRRTAPTLHRWTGRVFIFLAYSMALGGLAMVWIRGANLSEGSAWPIVINALLIMIFVTMALDRAIRRQIDKHRVWAMRAFLAVNGVWFLRVLMMFWVITTQGAGMNRTMSGWGDLTVALAAYIGPLLILELYLQAQRRAHDGLKVTAAIVVLLTTLITAIGVFGAINFMWIPDMRA